MSASSTPTVSPRAASAAARFAVTDDLPTPPLPLPDRDHARRGRHLGGGCAQLRLAASALHERRTFLLRHLAVVDGDLPDAREARDLGLHVGRDLAPQRAGRGRERHLHPDVTVRRDVDVLDHPEVDDADVELGIEDAREHAAHVVRGGGRRQRVDHLLVHRWHRGHGCHRRNKNSVDLENMPDSGLRSSRNGHARGAQGTRRRDPFLDVPRARVVDASAERARARGSPRHPRQHRPPPPRTAPRGGPRRRRSRAPRHGRPPAARLRARLGRARASGSTRRATRCLPVCSPRSPNESVPTPTKRPRSAAEWGADAGRRARTRSCDKALVAELERLGFDPVAERDGDDVSIAFLHCPFRELAEAYPELVCNLHRGICEGVVNAGRRGKRRRLRDVVRPRPVPSHRRGRVR